MGQFNINLPDNRKGNVRWGKTMKISTLFRLLPWIKGNLDEKTGYFVNIEPSIGKDSEYRLFKTKEGSWFQDEEGKIPLEGETMLSIKKAIEEHEKISN